MKIATLTLSLVAVLFTASCGKDGSSTPASTPPSATANKPKIPDTFKLAAAPAAFVTAGKARAEAKTGDVVTVIGRVGGHSENPFVPGLASFTIVDPVMKPCGEDGMDGCKTPWDYCCADPDEMKKSTIVVEFRDDGNRPFLTTAKGFNGIEPLKTVYVTGRAEKDDGGNLVVVASGIFVRP